MHLAHLTPDWWTADLPLSCMLSPLRQAITRCSSGAQLPAHAGLRGSVFLLLNAYTHRQCLQLRWRDWYHFYCSAVAVWSVMCMVKSATTKRLWSEAVLDKTPTIEQSPMSKHFTAVVRKKRSLLTRRNLQQDEAHGGAATCCNCFFFFLFFWINEKEKKKKHRETGQNTY